MRQDTGATTTNDTTTNTTNNNECGNSSTSSIELDEEEDQVQPQQCCLTAGVLFLICLLLITTMASLLIASAFTERLRAARMPCLAVMGMAVFLAFITGMLAAFVERRLQERFVVCRLVYCVTCLCCLDSDERRELFWRKKGTRKSSMCELTESSSPGESTNYNNTTNAAISTGNGSNKVVPPEKNSHRHVNTGFQFTPQHFQRNRHYP